MARTLPPAVDQVTIPATFPVTAIASANGCKLRLVVAASAGSPKGLPAGPKAELGSLGHVVMERVARGDGPADEAFEACVQETRARLMDDATTAGYADLPSVIGPPAWSRFRADVMARCERMTISPRTRRRGASAGALTPGREKSFMSVNLRLRGRLDVLRRLHDGYWEIRDYKLGRVLDHDGGIRSEIVFQLRTYGLLALEREAAAEIRLVVDDGQEHEIAFGPEERREARQAVKRALRGLTVGRSLRATDLASPGVACADCPFRHRCTAYQAIAPRWWQLDPGSPTELAADVWGIVIARDSDLGSDNITLRDDAGRQVTIDRLDHRHGIGRSALGQTLWLFDLESTVARRAADGRRIHPVTFHELPVDSAQRRAWSCQVFTAKML